MLKNNPKQPTRSGYVCDFSNVHPLSETCRCGRKYELLACEFRAEAVKRLGQWVEEARNGNTRTVLARPVYASDISPHVRDEIIRDLTNS